MSGWKQSNQGCVADHQGVPTADLESAAEMSKIGIGAAVAAWREYPFCRRATGSGPQKRKVPQDAQLARRSLHPEIGLLQLGEGHEV